VSLASATIGEIVADLRSGFASGEDVADGVVQFRMNNVARTGEINWDKLRRVPGSKARDHLLVEKGDILFNATNSPELVGKTALFVGFAEPVTFSNHFIRIRTKQKTAEPAYVARWLQREFERGRFAGMCRSWVNQASVTKDQRLPLPPLDEQRRIAAILDKADVLRRKRKHALELLDELVRSFVDFAHKGASPTALIGDLCDVQGGLQVSRSRAVLPIEVPYLRVANVYRDRLDLSEIKAMHVTQAELERTILSKGDILFVEGHGNADEIGRCAVWDGSVSPCVHQNHLIRARLKSGGLDAIIVSHWINSRDGRQHLLKRGKTTSGLNTISVSDVRATPVPVLQLDQRRKLRWQLEKAGQMKIANAALYMRLNTLFSSLQHTAFSVQL
jgi:type I restriction enzyme S subunit